MWTTRTIPSLRPWIYGLVAALGVCAWQSATAAANYGGNWTAFFCAAGEGRVPPELEAGTYRFKGTPGYDGQFYRLIAHDPWSTKNYANYIDDAGFRYRRILLPAVAWMLAAGDAARVDSAYFAAIWLFVFAGTALSALYLRATGWPEECSILFPILPGVLVCVDRMTVDLALYACMAGALAAAARRNWTWCWVFAALAGLSRDLGLIVAGALILHSLSEMRWMRAAAFCTALLPTALWYAHISRLFPSMAQGAPLLPPWTMQRPLIGHVQALFRPVQYPMGPALLWITQWLDRLVLIGVFAVFVIALLRLRRRPWSMESGIGLGFALVYLLVGSPYFWLDLYSSFRAFTPLLAVVAIAPGAARFGLHQVPLALMTFRFLWQLGPQCYGILRHWGALG